MRREGRGKPPRRALVAEPDESLASDIGGALVLAVFNLTLLYLGNKALTRLCWRFGVLMAEVLGGKTDDDRDEGE